MKLILGIIFKIKSTKTSLEIAQPSAKNLSHDPYM